jgi:hypothetical protein
MRVKIMQRPIFRLALLGNVEPVDGLRPMEKVLLVGAFAGRSFNRSSCFDFGRGA